MFPEKRLDATLKYRIDASTNFFGADTSVISETIGLESPFMKVQPISTFTQEDGYLLVVKIDQLTPSIASTIFGISSLSTLTVLPFWSTRDGSKVTFTLYKDGKAVDAKDYTIRRKSFVWILMLPFAWVNAFTASQEEALTAVTRDYLTQMTPYLVVSKNP